MTPPLDIPLHRRRKTRVVEVGPLKIGGDNPILIQSMTIADTMETDAVVREIRELYDAGCPLVRVTAPHVPAAENLREIKRRLRAAGLEVPLVADIHFTPNAALVAAEIVEKVRVNPGNYADRKRFATREYSDAEYASELDRLRNAFLPLVRRCKETGAAMRIGTNHGSLSDRIMNRYGDTPAGMVESALEFVRICEDEGYHAIVLSMKSSIPSVMIAAYRLLVERMDALGMHYPLHLGVTEAGDGLEGRIKSAVGIGSLLADGIGDTIRVSLTEDSVHELPAARAILDAVARELASRDQERVVIADSPSGARGLSTDAVRPRRATNAWVLGSLLVGGSAPVRVEQRIELPPADTAPTGVDLALLGQDGGAELLSIAWRDAWPSLADLRSLRAQIGGTPLLLEGAIRGDADVAALSALLPVVDAASLAFEHRASIEASDPYVRQAARALLSARKPARFRLRTQDSAEDAIRIDDICRAEGLNLTGYILDPRPGWIEATRALAASLPTGALLFLEAPLEGPDAGLLAGAALTDGIGDALCLISCATPAWPRSERKWEESPVESAYTILQATRLRLTKAEFIACPSCGRTMFDLQTTTARIQARTGHLKGVKIAVMGCIVNGPGEMADADFGYVGSGPAKVDLYVGKDRVRQGVPQHEAEDRLVELIQAHGRWIDPATGAPFARERA